MTQEPAELAPAHSQSTAEGGSQQEGEEGGGEELLSPPSPSPSSPSLSSPASEDSHPQSIPSRTCLLSSSSPSSFPLSDAVAPSSPPVISLAVSKEGRPSHAEAAPASDESTLLPPSPPLPLPPSPPSSPSPPSLSSLLECFTVGGDRIL